MNRPLILAAAAAVVVVVLAALAFANTHSGPRRAGRLASPAPASPTSQPARLGACGHVDPTTPTDLAVVHITNSTAVARHYHITVYFNDASGERIDTTYANAWNVRPGGRVRVEAVSGQPEPVKGVSCEIGDAVSIPAAEARSGDIWWPAPVQ